MTQYAIGAWTRVGERLPEYGEQVLAWTGEGGYPVIACLRRDEHGDFWEGFHNGEEVDPACVTLWTPMPPPPPFEQNTEDQQPRTKEAAHMSDTNERSVASAGSVAGEPTTQAAFHRWQEFCKSCGFRLYDTPESMSAFLEGIRFGRATSLTDAEREAIANGIYLCEGEAGQANENINANAWAKTAGVLRGLLERLGHQERRN